MSNAFCRWHSPLSAISTRVSTGIATSLKDWTRHGTKSEATSVWLLTRPCRQPLTLSACRARLAGASGASPARRYASKSCLHSGERGGSGRPAESWYWFRYGSHTVSTSGRSRGNSTCDWKNASASGLASLGNCMTRCCSLSTDCYSDFRRLATCFPGAPRKPFKLSMALSPGRSRQSPRAGMRFRACVPSRSPTTISHSC